MFGEFGEVTAIIGLVINFLAFVSPLCAFRDTSTYVEICRDILMTFMTHGNVIFDILEPPSFRKYSTRWVLQKFENLVEF